MTVISTTLETNATAYSNQKHLARTSNNVLWACFLQNDLATVGAIDFEYSTNDGSSWTLAEQTGFSGSSGTYVPSVSMFIDLDDYMHVVYKDAHSGHVRYRRGTPNAGKTDYTFSSDVAVGTGSFTENHPDLIAHREGTGWKVHLVYTRFGATHNNTYYTRLNVTSGGTITSDVTGALLSPGGNGYSVNQSTYPTVDFHHTGDGKTVKDGTPHVFFAWNAGKTGSGFGVRFKKATYSAGPTWTVGTEREIDSTRYVSDPDTWLNTIFDGSRVVIGGLLLDGTKFELMIYERNVADTTTTTRLLAEQTGTNRIFGGSAAVDVATGNVLLVGTTTATPNELSYHEWDRTAETLGSKTNISTTDIAQRGYVSTLRLPQNNILELVHTNDTPSVVFENVALNAAPSNTWVSPPDGSTQDTERPLLLEWDYSDPEGDAQTHYTIRRNVDALGVKYWNGTDWQASEDASTKIAGSNVTIEFDKGWGDVATETEHVYAVKTWDAGSGTAGSFSADLQIFPFSATSRVRGFALPKPYKKQENLIGTLKSNNDYMLSWVNSYVPAYGDLNDDLYLKAGVRPGATSTLRSAFPPSVGVFSIGNGTNYFQDLGATNVYRSNELSLSSEKYKEFYESSLENALGLILAVPVEEFGYLEEKRNGDSEFRFGIVLEDLKYALGWLGIDDVDSAFIIRDKQGEEHLNTDQLVYVLWKAVQELYDMVDKSGKKRVPSFRRRSERKRKKFARRRNQK